MKGIAKPIDAPEFDFQGAVCPTPLRQDQHILLGHGGGGKLSAELVEQVIAPEFANDHVRSMEDSTIVPVAGTRIAMSTDSYVVQPLFFPGGDIGQLAVHGTINDLAMSGATPKYLTTGFVIEEGFAIDDLRRIARSMGQAAKRAGVAIVAGDTKVVQRGHGDGVYINTAGVGFIDEEIQIHSSGARVGDVVIVSGPIGNHGMAIMSVREGLEFESPIQSDTADLSAMVRSMLIAARTPKGSQAPEGSRTFDGSQTLDGSQTFDGSQTLGGSAIRVMRDPTRGGLSTSLNEIASSSRVGIEIDEAAIPIDDPVRGACEFLGLDPMEVANEGKLVAIVAPDRADAILQAMRSHCIGEAAKIIGEVTADPNHLLVGRTALGARRVITMPIGEQLPRIC
ncbi:MAG: hydrogenase expression/formation protein HypE [Planctomycetota bacterium]